MRSFILYSFIFIMLAFQGTVSAAPSTPSTPIVFVDEVKPTVIADQLIYPVRIAAAKNAVLLSELDGTIEQIPATLGRSVKKGQTMLVIRNTDPVYHYAAVPVGAGINGIVSTIDVSVGSHVTRGQRLATITDPSSMKFYMEVAAIDLPAFAPGLKGKLFLDATGAEATVRIAGISPLVDAATGTAACELELDASSKTNPFPPGSVARAHFQVRSHEGIQVPDSAVIYRGKEPFLRTVENGTAKYAPVTVGSMRRGMVEVLSGLSAGSQVVVRSSGFISDGQAVTVQREEVAKN